MVVERVMEGAPVYVGDDYKISVVEKEGKSRLRLLLESKHPLNYKPLPGDTDFKACLDGFTRSRR